MNENSQKFQFLGKGQDLLVIYLKNIFFIIITLGIYNFWARVRVTKFYYQNTEFLKGRFDYHATGKEKFLGFLKAIGLIFAYIIVLGIIMFGLSKIIGQQEATIIISVITYVTIVAIIPLIMIGKHRYELSRSSLRNIRFRFTGNAKEFFVEFLKGILLSLVTVGIYGPWFLNRIEKYFTDNSYYGNQKFEYNGNGNELAKKYYIGLLLTIVTLGIYLFWWIADLTRFKWGHTSFQGKKFESTITGGLIFKTLILSSLLVIFTLGIGLAWASIMNKKIHLETLSIEGEIDLASIEAVSDKSGSALAEGIEDAADVIGGMID